MSRTNDASARPTNGVLPTGSDTATADAPAATPARESALLTGPESLARFKSLLVGTSRDPHALLGLHPAPGVARGRVGLLVRVFAPDAEAVTLRERGGRRQRVPLQRLSPEGLFGAIVPGRRTHFPYSLEFRRGQQSWERGDPYRFLPTLGEQDVYFLGEGTHRELYNYLGAHPRTIDGEAGVAFAVWAPSARGVSVVGDFNGWQRRALPMRSLGPTGLWELFVPGLALGARYKYAIRGADGLEVEKADPLAFASEVRPRTASVIANLDSYQWQDAAWLAARATADRLHGPMSIYEVHLGSWRRHDDGSWLTYRELAEELPAYATGLGFTHIELLPVSEHPFDGSWGYQITGFYAPTSRFGSPADFQYFVDRCHQAGLGVLMDWVPAHFAVDSYALGRFDGTYLYEHADPRRRYQPDWGTLVFNYGRREVRNFLIANALFWLEKYHIDGLRVDAVSAMLYLDYSRQAGDWVPNKYGGREHLEAIDLLREVNALIYGLGTGALTIAEESTAWPGVSRPVYAQGLGFGFKWNMGWMHDTLEYFAQDPIYRQYHQGKLTFLMVYAYSENFILALSHDEVVHGKGSLLRKMPGDEWRQFANLRLLYAYQHALPGKKLIFMGDEFGQRPEWDHDSQLAWSSLDYAPHARLRALVADLNRLHQAEPALHARDFDPAGFAWLDCNDTVNSVVSFVRRGDDPDDYLICACNFTPVVRYDYRIPVPEVVVYREVLNTDAARYGGSDVGNYGQVVSEARPLFGHPYTLSLTLPPLAALYFKPDRSQPVPVAVPAVADAGELVNADGLEVPMPQPMPPEVAPTAAGTPLPTVAAPPVDADSPSSTPKASAAPVDEPAVAVSPAPPAVEVDAAGQRRRRARKTR